jgi:photosystem II stability/assembly factor-like uncharacterized protein
MDAMLLIDRDKQESIDGLPRRHMLLAGVGLGMQVVMLPAASHAEEPRPLHHPAAMTPRASRSVLVRVVRAGDRLVAIGERGLVVLSDDHGRQWRQVRVPVSVTLTSASFINERQGWIVGHGGVVLNTTDGGESWDIQTDGIALAKAALVLAQGLPASDVSRERSIQQAQQLVDEGADKPLLAIYFADEKRGMAVGAYGLAAITTDGGKTWLPSINRLPNARSMHLYAVANYGRDWVVAGEQGVLMRSNNDGTSFQLLASPLKRSFFSATVKRNGGFVLSGLLGSACQILPGTATVVPVALPSSTTILSSLEMRDGRVMLLAQGGRILVSSDGGIHFQNYQPPRRELLTSLIEAADGGLIATSLSGVSRVS